MVRGELENVATVAVQRIHQYSTGHVLYLVAVEGMIVMTEIIAIARTVLHAGIMGTQVGKITAHARMDVDLSLIVTTELIYAQASVANVECMVIIMAAHAQPQTLTAPAVSKDGVQQCLLVVKSHAVQLVVGGSFTT